VEAPTIAAERCAAYVTHCELNYRPRDAPTFEPTNSASQALILLMWHRDARCGEAVQLRGSYASDCPNHEWRLEQPISKLRWSPRSRRSPSAATGT
jgi:hypothetical protein